VREPGGGIVTVDEVHRAADRVVERVAGSRAKLAEERLQLAPAEFDRVQVGRVRRELPPRAATESGLLTVFPCGRGGSAPFDLVRRVRLTTCPLRRKRCRRTCQRSVTCTGGPFRGPDEARGRAPCPAEPSFSQRSAGGPDYCKGPTRPGARRTAIFLSDPAVTRTRDLRFRKPPLYPAELRGQALHITECSVSFGAGAIGRRRRQYVRVRHRRARERRGARAPRPRRPHAKAVDRNVGRWPHVRVRRPHSSRDREDGPRAAV
jgi:hypothetical protein